MIVIKAIIQEFDTVTCQVKLQCASFCLRHPKCFGNEK